MSGFYHSGFPQDTSDPTANSVEPSFDSSYDTGLIEDALPNAGHWINSTGHEQMEGPKSSPRRRRPSGDHVKHRRTRNGCYTCRSRRVKCDEIRPICERCQKGNRECAYPEPRSAPKPSGGSKKNQSPTAADDSEFSSEEEGSAAQSVPVGRRRNRSAPKKPSSVGSKGTRPKAASPPYPTPNLAELPRPSVEQVKQESSLSPSTEASSAPSAGLDSQKFSSVSTDTSQDDRRSGPWTHLAQDMQFYLDYHRTHLTSHHYFFKHEANHFIHAILIEHALKYDPLLYAVVGFAAFHLTVTRPNGKIQDFLGYYNKSVSLLRKSLIGNEKHTNATMLTILQLATFEDYLGDWVSLLGHSKAAYGMLLELYTSQTIMNNELSRKLLSWYSRFDVTSGLMSGYETVLGRDWFTAVESHYREQSSTYPLSLDYKIETTIARHRLLASDLAVLFAQFARGAISLEDFTTGTNDFAEQIRTWKDRLDPVFKDNKYLVRSFAGRQPDPEDIVNPYLPEGMYTEPLFTFNFMLMDWHTMNIMHKYKTASLLKRAPPPELKDSALEICRLFEAIEYWPGSPQGAYLKAKGSLGLAILFLPKDEKHIMWCRRKLAKVEGLGHIYPATLRNQMAEVWGLPEVRHWWLPDDEACPAVVRSIHTFMADRLTNVEGQSRSEDQRNIKGIFSQLSVGDNPKSSPSSSRGNAMHFPIENSATFADEGEPFQSLAVPPGDVDLDTASDNSMLDQTRESFYVMADKDLEVQRKLRAQRGQ